MNEEWMIDVAGVSAGGWQVETEELVMRAELIVAGQRILDMITRRDVEKIPLDASALRNLERILARAKKKRTLFLASGDPLYNGIGGTLRRYLPEERLRIHPNPTAFQELFAKLAVPWENAALFSVHGKKTLPWRRILRSKLAVIYCDAEHSAKALAAELIAKYPGCASRRAVAGCDIGMESEFIRSASLAEIAEDPGADRSLSILVLLEDRAMPPLALGLDDGYYEHAGNMITHPEVRAVVLSKLRLHGGVMWDVGAGSGSVGLEAAGLCPALSVYAVEKNAERAEQIRRNAERESPAEFHLCEGTFSDLEKELPDPDFVFVGGGGAELENILKKAFERLNPGGVMAATAVMAESCCVLARTLKEFRRELLVLNLARALPLGDGTCYKAENPITLAVFSKKGEK